MPKKVYNTENSNMGVNKEVIQEAFTFITDAMATLKWLRNQIFETIKYPRDPFWQVINLPHKTFLQQSTNFWDMK